MSRHIIKGHTHRRSPLQYQRIEPVSTAANRHIPAAALAKSETASFVSGLGNQTLGRAAVPERIVAPSSGPAVSASGTISTNVDHTVTLGIGGYSNALIITSSGVIAPSSYGASGLDIPAPVAGALVINHGVIQAGQGANGGGGGDGILIAAAGARVSNFGAIYADNSAAGTGSDGIDITGANDTITNSQDIFGGYHHGSGIRITGADATIVNEGYVSGAISYNDAGIYIGGAGATITNEGRIYGSGYTAYGAIDITAADARITNTGLILAFYGNAISVQGNGANISNSGEIKGGERGVGILINSDSAVIENTGTIAGYSGGDQASGHIALEATQAGVTITNQGDILGGAGPGTDNKIGYGGGAAIYFKSADILTNSGTIVGGAGGFSNPPGVGGSGGVAVMLAAGGTVTNGGTITGGYGGDFGGSGGNGIAMVSGDVLTNNGIIYGGAGGEGYFHSTGPGHGGNGVWVAAGGMVTNSGTIAGGYHGGTGVYVGSSTLINSGTISGGTSQSFQYYGVGVVLNGGTLINDGTIAGGNVDSTAVTLGAQAGTVIVDPGAKFNGDVEANANVADVLEFAGSTTGTASYLGTDFSNFATIEITQGSSWFFIDENELTKGEHLKVTGALNVIGTFSTAGAVYNTGIIDAASGTVSLAGAVSGTGALEVSAGATLSLGVNPVLGGIADFLATTGLVDLTAPLAFSDHIGGFGASDEIDLLNTAETDYSYANHVLTVKNGSQVVAALDFNGSYTKSDFSLGGDGHGGTMITFK